mmetsp:Transcript_122943/g.274535  ORF Transcript_122943/g.274535 Transcript_122943/m.274535 type:complete len:256 (+) Transcript_122943:1141-1908(+)
MVEQLCKVVVEGMLPSCLAGLVVQETNPRANTLEGRPRLRQLHLCEALDHPLVFGIALLIGIEVREPLLEARPLTHAPQHGHHRGLLQGALRGGVRNTEEPEGVRIEEVERVLGELLAIFEPLQGLDPDGVDVVRPLQDQRERRDIPTIGIWPSIHDLELRTGSALAGVEVDHLVVHGHAGGEACRHISRMQVLWLVRVGQVLEAIHLRHVSINHHPIAIGDHLVLSRLRLDAHYGDLELGRGHPLGLGFDAIAS